METITLVAEPRTISGKKTKQLRKEQIIPAVIFEAGEDSQNIQLSLLDFRKVLKLAGHSTLVDLKLEGKTAKVLINEVQYSPRNGEVTHVMLNKVNLKEEITAEVPVELEGESPAVKVEKGILVTPVDAIEIRCLPTDLPAKIIVNIATLEKIGDSLTIADITLPKGVKLVHEDDVEKVLVSAVGAQKEEVETAAPSPDDVVVEEKGKKEEEA